MTELEFINIIQKEINHIKTGADNCDLDDWVMDHIHKIQMAINDYRNREFKPSEPDPFN